MHWASWYDLGLSFIILAKVGGTVSNFEIRGKYKGGIVGKTWLPFSKVVESESEKNAVNKVYSLMGSEHGLKRDLIKIDEVKAVE
jgi:large subunit ribosomal protein LX